MNTLIVTLIGVATLAAALLMGNPSFAEACAGLIGSNGAVNLGKTTTFAGYANGVEHYITAFQFQGGGGEFGSLIPLPGVPTNIERGGDWTLQRLVKETQVASAGAAGGTCVGAACAANTGGGVTVLQEVQIDALDLTVLEGGAPAIAVWATEHGFRLSPDAPEVLDFYAARSSIFLAAVFNAEAAAGRGQLFGDGTPVHITIPTDNPWVPLRILGLGKQPDDFVSADVFLLTERAPAVLPGPREGLFIQHSAPATDTLLNDLRSDAGGTWIPQSGWLTKYVIGSRTADLRYDLAVDASGAGKPSALAAGLIQLPKTGGLEDDSGDGWFSWSIRTVAGASAIPAALAILWLGIRMARRWPDA